MQTCYRVYVEMWVFHLEKHFANALRHHRGNRDWKSGRCETEQHTPVQHPEAEQ